MPKPGRPTKKTPEIIAEICRLIAEETCFQYQACKRAGIHIDTLLEWVKADPAVADAVRAAHRAKLDGCLQLIQKASLGKAPFGADWKAAAWLCERTDPANYSLHNRVEVRGDLRITREALEAEERRLEEEISTLANPHGSHGPPGQAGKPGPEKG